MPIEDDIQFNIVIPKKSLNQIIHIIEKDEMIDLYVSDRKVLFVIGQYLVLTRLIDGTYPNTSRLVLCLSIVQHYLVLSAVLLYYLMNRVIL